MWERSTSSVGLPGVSLRCVQRRLEGIEVVGDLAEFDDVPAVAPEAAGYVVAVGEFGLAVDRDVVVVVDRDELVEPEVAGERGRLVRHALHQATVTGDHERVVVDGVGAEPVGEDPLGDRHADSVGEALTERSGGDLDARRVTGLGVAGGRRLPLTERLQVVELEAVTGEEQHRVLQDRRVPGGEDEAVPVGPGRVGGVERHDPAVQHVRERRQCHRRALVAAVGRQRSVHGEATDHGDGLLVEFGGER